LTDLYHHGKRPFKGTGTQKGEMGNAVNCELMGVAILSFLG